MNPEPENQINEEKPASNNEEIDKGKNIVVDNQTNELVFCVVGHIGSGTSQVAKALSTLLTQHEYECEIVKASDLITEKTDSIKESNKIQRVESLQDAGDELRKKDLSYVARLFILQIRKLRAKHMGIVLDPSKPLNPDGHKRAYILDSVKHPQEIEMLGKVYKSSFIAIGVVCDEEIRSKRIKEKLDINISQATDVMKRDAKDGTNKHGKRVSDAFYLSDFFLDNTEDEKNDGNPNPAWVINDNLARLISIITHAIVVRPTLSETAMFHGKPSIHPH